jgi:hypothetical protein
LGATPIGSDVFTAANAAGIQAILPIQQNRTDVASAGTVNLTSAAPSNDHIQITGTTTINDFTVLPGRMLFVRFSGQVRISSGPDILTQTGGDLISQPGATCIIRAIGTNSVEIIAFTLAASNSVSANGFQRLPGGLILQWLSTSLVSGANSVSFPVGFPNAAYSVVATAGGNNGGNNTTSFVSGITTSGFSLTNATGVTSTWNVIAVGY